MADVMRDQDSVAVLADDVHGRFFWMVSPDAKGNHTVSHESVRKVVELTEAIQSQQDGAQGGDAADPWTPSGVDYDRTIHHNADARAWADFFVQTFPGQAAQQELMVGWFANAMMAQHDFDRSRRAIAPQATPAADTARLDFLLKHEFCVKRLGDTGQFMLTDASGYPCTGGEFDTPREAIDDCLAAPPAEVKP